MVGSVTCSTQAFTGCSGCINEDTRYPHLGSSWFSSVSPGKCEDNTFIRLWTLSNSTYHPTLLHNLITNSAVKPTNKQTWNHEDKKQKHINSSNLINSFTELSAELYGWYFIYSKKGVEKNWNWTWQGQQHGQHTTNTPTQMQNLLFCYCITCLMASFHSDQRFLLLLITTYSLCVTEMRQNIAVLDFRGSYYSVTAEMYTDRKYLLFPCIRLT
jgi:hypothetical protein